MLWFRDKSHICYGIIDSVNQYTYTSVMHLYMAARHMDLCTRIHQSVPLLRPSVSILEALMSNIVLLHLLLQSVRVPSS